MTFSLPSTRLIIIGKRDLVFELEDILNDRTKPHRLPGLQEIIEAQRRIAGVATRTPLVEAPSLSKRFGREVYLKLECYQPVRVVKFRGAYNKISQIPGKDILALTSGNHGISVAYVCRLLGKKCTIVLPEGAVQEKVNCIQEFGADIVRFQGNQSRGAEKAREIVKATGATFVHPFNDPDVIAGQGTCGLEITEQLADFDSVIVPVGGGGVIAGIAIAVKSKKPSAKIFGVEPQAVPKLQAAMSAGRLVSVTVNPTIADGLIPPSVGDLTLEACMKHVSGVFTVSEEEIISAMNLLIREAHIFPEPSGAASAAPLVAGREVDRLGKRVVLIITGGNISLKLLAQNLSA